MKDSNLTVDLKRQFPPAAPLYTLYCTHCRLSCIVTVVSITNHFTMTNKDDTTTTTTTSATKDKVSVTSFDDKDSCNSSNNESILLLSESTTTAVLYQTVDIHQGCGHAIPFQQWQDRILHRTVNPANNNNKNSHHDLDCPICHCSVGMVMDGCVAASRVKASAVVTQVAAGKNNDDHDDDCILQRDHRQNNINDNNSNNNNIVCFKYGKQIYLLSTAVSSQQQQHQQQHEQPNLSAPSDVTKKKRGGILSSFLFLPWFSSVPFSPQPNHTNDTNTGDDDDAAAMAAFSTATETSNTILAQDRIVQALKFMDRSKLKIFYQGKVLHPPPPRPPISTTAFITPTVPIQEEDDDTIELVISKKLLEISKHDLTLASTLSNPNNSSNNKLKKPSLVVMGTRLADLQSIQRGRQQPTSPIQGTHNNNNNNNDFRWWNHNILRLPISILTIMVQVSWLMIGTFVTPLLPHSWTEQWRRVTNNNNNNNNNNGPVDHDHEHVE